jgi:hypothetical protein
MALERIERHLSWHADSLMYADQDQLEGSRRVLRVSDRLLEDVSAGSPVTGIGHDAGGHCATMLHKQL